jgi:AcrR family transcriptional regulator
MDKRDRHGVAREAGVTKGGVLHHFPSKEALMNGLIGEVINAFKTRDELLRLTSVTNLRS